jgi:hypothetical protein
MPLPKAAPRKLQHLRDIDLRGYEREDGLIDLEAHMTDVKTYSFGNRDRGAINAGEPLHDMWLRLTINHAMTIEAVEAAMDSTPHTICPGVVPNFQRLVGLNIGKGFLKNAAQQLGGIEGCTHLRELLQQLGTVAYQTMFGIRGRQKEANQPRRIPTMLLNSCYAYNETGPLAASSAAE